MENNRSNKEEAIRWLNLAEKLLEGHDLVGCKTFAIRARESDPSLEHVDLILAVVDTLMAGQSRVNNSTSMHDWYSILQLTRLTRDPELVSTQYRKLALLLNPQRNRLPFSDEAFRLVSEAWSVLSNPSKKWYYDNELTLLDSAGSTQLHLQQQQQHQQHQPVRKSPRSGNVPSQSESTRVNINIPGESTRVNINIPGESTRLNVNVPSQKESTRVNARSQDESTRVNLPCESSSDTFWTACPYCYSLFEYPRVYEDCTLRCQNCRRAFHGVVISSPPVIEAGKDGSFCCWGFFPLGFSEGDYRNQAKDMGGATSWSPFSPMFVCPVGGVPQGGSKPKNVSKRNPRPKAVIIDDDDDVLLELSDASDGSDDDWDSSREKKKTKNTKGKSPAKSAKKGVRAEKVKNVNQKVGNQAKGSNGLNLQGGFVNDSVAETSHKATGNSSIGTRRQSGRHAKELGKLDLNVEFSNEVEAPITGVHGGHGGTEDNIEGIAFFEGLDEFLSSLPILSAVGGDDKVKAA